jgi:LPXTG-motif cell wall-anchored protein
VGQRDRALQLYNTARGLYETHNFPDDALSLTGLISQRFGTPIPQNQTFSPIAIIAVIALIGIGFWFFRKKKDKGYSGDSTSPDEPDISAFAREIPQRKDSGVSEKQFIGTVAPKQQSAADTAAKEDAKQKMARKIRERYGLKPEQE